MRLTLLPSGEYLRHHKGFERGFQGVNLMGQKVPIYHALSDCKPVKQKSARYFDIFINRGFSSSNQSSSNNVRVFSFINKIFYKPVLELFVLRSMYRLGLADMLRYNPTIFNTLACLLDGMNDSLNKRLMFQELFFS